MLVQKLIFSDEVAYQVAELFSIGWFGVSRKLVKVPPFGPSNAQNGHAFYPEKTIQDQPQKSIHHMRSIYYTIW